MSAVPPDSGWSQVASAAEIGRSLTTRRIGDLAIVLYRTEAGEVITLEDRCSHMALPLSNGRLEGDAVRCLYHGLLFNSAGRCIEMRGQSKIPDGARVGAYPVIERDGEVWVSCV